MSNKIVRGGNLPPAIQRDREMGQLSNELGKAAKDSMKDAGKALGKAGDHVIDSALNVAGGVGTGPVHWLFSARKYANAVSPLSDGIRPDNWLLST